MNCEVSSAKAHELCYSRLLLKIFLCSSRPLLHGLILVLHYNNFLPFRIDFLKCCHEVFLSVPHYLCLSIHLVTSSAFPVGFNFLIFHPLTLPCFHTFSIASIQCHLNDLFIFAIFVFLLELTYIFGKPNSTLLFEILLAPDDIAIKQRDEVNKCYKPLS